MNTYTFRLLPAKFTAQRIATYDELEHKKINEYIEEIEITIKENDITSAIEKANKEVAQAVLILLGQEVLSLYNFKFKLVHMNID